jgi:hypothetical protein
MIEIKQTRLHTDDLTQPPGNCFQACLASIFELPIDKVPDEVEVWKSGERAESWPKYWQLINSWLASRNLSFLEVEINSAIRNWNDTYEIITGPSPRNKGRHAVVGYGGKIIFDPHPDNTGLKGTEDEWTYGFFVKINPAIDFPFPKVLPL